MNETTPSGILKRLADAVPPGVHEKIIVVGSVAAAYHFAGDEDRPVRTKDIDCMVVPRSDAPAASAKIANSLVDAGWTHRTDHGFGTPQRSPQPETTLSAIRLLPPDSHELFLELLTAPEPDTRGKTWIPVELENGFYGVPSFEFLSLVAHRPLATPFGLRYARPEMMVLANMLSHPQVGTETMGSPIGGRTLKRSNKDLGRALAVARLARDDVEAWPAEWIDGLRTCFPTRCRDLARGVGRGLRQLLDSPDDFEQAFYTCTYGLLAGEPLTMDQLNATGRRVIVDAIEPLEAWGAGAPEK